MTKRKLVVIGGDAAGMSAASKVRRTQNEWEFVVFEGILHEVDAKGIFGLSTLQSGMDVFEYRRDHRLKNAVGKHGAAKRIDTLAIAITARMTARDLAFLDLSYAPPFSGLGSFADCCKDFFIKSEASF